PDDDRRPPAVRGRDDGVHPGGDPLGGAGPGRRPPGVRRLSPPGADAPAPVAGRPVTSSPGDRLPSGWGDDIHRRAILGDAIGTMTASKRGVRGDILQYIHVLQNVPNAFRMPSAGASTGPRGVAGTVPFSRRGSYRPPCSG